jgi:PAS domain S-box-containing protein
MKEKWKGGKMGEILKQSHSLLEAVPATFLFTDIHSRILYANRQTESFFGYSVDELEGERIRILFLEEDLIHFLPNIIYLTRYKDGFDGEALLRRKDGKKIFVHLFTSAFAEGGDIFLSFGFQEIQRLKLLERERLEAERWAGLGHMVEEIAHQFRNPIASVGGYAKRILKGSVSSPKAKNYLDHVLQETGRLETILRRVEELVQIPRPVFRRDNMGAIVEDAFSVLCPKAAAKGITLRTNQKDLKDEGSCFADRQLLIRTLDQVLENSYEAILAKPAKTRKKIVDLSILDEGENISLRVTDWGQGIPKKNLGMIFDPFFTTHPERVGLGLTFVWRVMEEHGGAVRINSVTNRGTTITLTFPKDRRRKVRREWLAPEAAVLEDR